MWTRLHLIGGPTACEYPTFTFFFSTWQERARFKQYGGEDGASKTQRPELIPHFHSSQQIWSCVLRISSNSLLQMQDIHIRNCNNWKPIYDCCGSPATAKKRWRYGDAIYFVSCVSCFSRVTCFYESSGTVLYRGELKSRTKNRLWNREIRGFVTPGWIQQAYPTDMWSFPNHCITPLFTGIARSLSQDIRLRQLRSLLLKHNLPSFFLMLLPLMAPSPIHWTWQHLPPPNSCCLYWLYKPPPWPIPPSGLVAAQLPSRKEACLWHSLGSRIALVALPCKFLLWSSSFVNTLGIKFNDGVTEAALCFSSGVRSCGTLGSEGTPL